MMTMLLLLHAQADVTCAEQVRMELEVQGYRVLVCTSLRSPLLCDQ